MAGRHYDAARTSARIVARDCLVSYGANRYSVPWRLAKKSVVVRDADDGRIRIFFADELVAEHERAHGKHNVVIDPEHHAGLWERVMGRHRREDLSRDVVPAEPERLVLVGRDLPVVLVESRELSYYEEVAG